MYTFNTHLSLKDINPDHIKAYYQAGENGRTTAVIWDGFTTYVVASFNERVNNCNNAQAFPTFNHAMRFFAELCQEEWNASSLAQANYEPESPFLGQEVTCGLS